MSQFNEYCLIRRGWWMYVLSSIHIMSSIYTMSSILWNILICVQQLSNTHPCRSQVFIHRLHLYNNLHIHPNLDKYGNTIHPRCYGIHLHVLVFQFLTFDVACINTGRLYWIVFQHMVVLYTSLERSFFIPLDVPFHPPHLWSLHFVP
jgi:hypothetical protein